MTVQAQPESSYGTATATIGQNVIANLEARFEETADGMEHGMEDSGLAEISAVDDDRPGNPLAALGLQPHMQQRSMNSSNLYDRAGTSLGNHGATHRRKRHTGGMSRHTKEDTGGYGSRRKMPSSNKQSMFAIRETPATYGNQTTHKTAIPEILKTLRGFDACTARYDILKSQMT